MFSRRWTRELITIILLLLLLYTTISARARSAVSAAAAILSLSSLLLLYDGRIGCSGSSLARGALIDLVCRLVSLPLTGGAVFGSPPPIGSHVARSLFVSIRHSPTPRPAARRPSRVVGRDTSRGPTSVRVRCPSSSDLHKTRAATRYYCDRRGPM